MRKEMFDELMQSIREMREIEAGRMKPARVTTAEEILRRDVGDVASLRRRLGLSQRKFAALIGISVATLQNWEQGRRQPEGAARVLLRVAAAHPEAVLDVSARPTSSRKVRGAAVRRTTKRRPQPGRARADG